MDKTETIASDGTRVHRIQGGERVCIAFAVALVLGSLCGSRPAFSQSLKTLTWSSLDTLTGIETPEGMTAYKYDGDSQRTASDGPQGKVFYIRDRGGNLISSYDESSGEYTDYIYLNGRRIAKVSDSGVRHFYHTDAVGTPISLTDGDGSLSWRGEALPFGGEVQNSDVDQADSLKFAGKELDDESDYSYFGARYYDARIGRFLTSDPVDGDPALPQTWNRYAYAVNNPIIRYDRDGREDENRNAQTGPIRPGGAVQGLLNWASSHSQIAWGFDLLDTIKIQGANKVLEKRPDGYSREEVTLGLAFGLGFELKWETESWVSDSYEVLVRGVPERREIRQTRATMKDELTINLSIFSMDVLPIIKDPTSEAATLKTAESMKFSIGGGLLFGNFSLDLNMKQFFETHPLPERQYKPWGSNPFGGRRGF